MTTQTPSDEELRKLCDRIIESEPGVPVIEAGRIVARALLSRLIAPAEPVPDGALRVDREVLAKTIKYWARDHSDQHIVGGMVFSECLSLADALIASGILTPAPQEGLPKKIVGVMERHQKAEQDIRDNFGAAYSTRIEQDSYSIHADRATLLRFVRGEKP